MSSFNTQSEKATNRFLHTTFNENSVKEHELGARFFFFFLCCTALDLHATSLNGKLSRQ